MIRRKMKLMAVAGLVFALAFGLVGTTVAGSDDGQGEPGRYIVTLDTVLNEAAGEQIIERFGGVIVMELHLVNSYVVLIPAAAVNGLRGIPGVIGIVEDGRVWAIDAELDDSWGVKRIGAGVVHAYNKGTGINVAIIDTGIDYTHADLDANCADLDNNGIIDGWDFVNSDADPMDDNGHGTHCAGIVAAEDNDVGVVGVAPEADLYAVKVLDSSGSGYVSDVVAGIEWSLNNQMQVISMSLGTGTDYQVLQDACDAAYAAGIVVVAAAGNDGNPPGKGDNVTYPAKYSSVIAVAATDKDDTRARWSSTGADLELAAPGVGINSTLLGGGYGEKSGTSMASPHVAGVAALVIAGEGLTNVQVRTRLQETADDLGDAGWDAKYGYGLLDADEAAAPSGPVNDAPVVSITSPADGSTFDSGATIPFEGTASDTEDGDLTDSLSWTSSIDGQIGTGGSFSTTLSDGSHTITAEVTDSGGKTGSDSIGVVIVNDAPVVSITSPADGSTFDSGATILFEGTASDTEDGDLTGSLSWTSSIDGQIGSGGSFSTTLSDGSHTITASVTDSGGKTGSSSISITVGAPTEPTTVSVSSISYDTQGGRYGNLHLLITVALIDDFGNAVADASVSIDVYLDEVLYGSGTDTTGTDGTVTFKANNAPSGCYQTTVTEVIATGLTWDGTTPDNSFEKT